MGAPTPLPAPNPRSARRAPMPPATASRPASTTCPAPSCSTRTTGSATSSLGDCSNATHGEAVSQACRKLCGSCQDEESEVCDEKYHTKVVIDGVGSIYCDQIYPEECQEFDSVAKTCCKTCK